MTTYSLCLASGAVATTYLAECLARRRNLSVLKLRLLSLVLITGGLAGAHLFVVAARLVIPELHLTTEGSSMFGGIVSSGLLTWIFAKMMRMPIVLTYDVVSVSLPLGLAIGRLGCLSVGCCHGYCLGLPVQLVSSSLNLTALIILLLMYNKTGSDGRYPLLFLGFYGVKRFSFGFFRDDAPNVMLGMNIFQVLGIVFAFAGILGFFLWLTFSRPVVNRSTGDI